MRLTDGTNINAPLYDLNSIKESIETGEKWGRYWGFSDFGEHPIDLDWV